MATTTKPGYKTTEFWLSLMAMVIGTLLASGAIGDASKFGQLLGFLATVLSSLGYTVSRSLVKKKLPS